MIRPSREAYGPVAAPGSGHRVAVVEDDRDLGDLLELRLSMLPGVSVAARAANGREAVAIAYLLRPDLMTLDLDMPVMGGAEAIPLLRSAAPQMRIVVFTANDDALDAAPFAAPDAIVSKAATLSELAAVVSGLLLSVPEPPADGQIAVPAPSRRAISRGRRRAADRRIRR